jgi:hypothetical protein
MGCLRIANRGLERTRYMLGPIVSFNQRWTVFYTMRQTARPGSCFEIGLTMSLAYI